MPVIPEYQDTSIQGYQDSRYTRIPRYQNTRIQGYQDTRKPGYQHTRMPGYQYTRILHEVGKGKDMEEPDDKLSYEPDNLMIKLHDDLSSLSI